MLFQYFRPHRKIFLLDMFCALMVAVVDLAFPLASRYAMYEMLPDKKYGPFFVLMISAVLLLLIFVMTMVDNPKRKDVKRQKAEVTE